MIQDYQRYRTANKYEIYPGVASPEPILVFKDVPPKNCNPDGNVETVSQIRFDTNSRIFERNLPSQMLQTYLDVRPVSTKYSLLPIVDPRAKPSIPYVQQPAFHISKTFNPGNAGAPWSGFSSSINVESELRNQIYANQRCSQSVYVPDSRSDLYTERINMNQDNHSAQPFPNLFLNERFEEFNPNPQGIGKHFLLNNTRMEYRDKSTNCR